MGKGTEKVAQSSLGHNVGRAIFDRHSRAQEEAFLSNDLTAAQLPRAYGHEIGYVIRETSFFDAPHPHRLLKLWRCGEGIPLVLIKITGFGSWRQKPANCIVIHDCGDLNVNQAVPI